MSDRKTTYIAIASLIVATVGLVFGIYSWNKSDTGSDLQKRTELLKLISEYKAINVNIKVTMDSMKTHTLNSPIPTHIKKDGECIPVPEITRKMKADHEEIISGIEGILKVVENNIKTADQLRDKYSDYSQGFSQQYIEEEIAKMNDGIEVSRLLNRAPPKLDPIIIDPLANKEPNKVAQPGCS